jgi:3',5'-cyclic AMP phosphodiesterase CpdA
MNMNKYRMNRLLTLVIICLFNSGIILIGQNSKTIKPLADEPKGMSFMIANDMGRNGYYDQKPIAAAMGEWAGKAGIDFVAAAGDEHHFNGVASVTDPLWLTNFELIYSHPELMLDWYPVLGNHEYKGNSQAVIDYSKVSRRWVMPARYYTMVKKVDSITSIRLVFIDTAPFIGKYRKDSIDYPDVCKQDYKAQLHFIDSVLTVSTEKWKVVIGHHPVYANTTKNENERTDMQTSIDPILRKHKVDFYICGHIHNFQHIRQKNSPVDYFVNSSASLSRPVESTTGTLFTSDKSGFSICKATNNMLSISFINAIGESIYTYNKKK